MNAVTRVRGLLALLVLTAVLGAGPARAGSGPSESVEALLADHRFDEAKRIVEGRFGPDPSDPLANYFLGRIDLANGELDGAIHHLEQAVEAEPDNVDFRLELGEAYGEKTLGARFLAVPKWARRWKRELEKTFELAPQNLEARRRLIEYYLHAPAIGGGDRKKATVLAERTIEIDEVEGRLLAAYAYLQTDREAESLREYETVLALDPDNGAAHRGRARLFVDDGDTRSAEQWFRRALALDPDDAETRYWLARMYEQLKRKSEAVEEYQLLVQRTPYHDYASPARKRLEAMH